MNRLVSIELCAGAGGQALGLERAGFEPRAVVEIDPDCRATLALNRPNWPLLHGDACDVRKFSGTGLGRIDLLAAGLPCPPFSVAGKQLGAADERNLFPDALRILGDCSPSAVMIENVAGLLGPAFGDYRRWFFAELAAMGYEVDVKLLNARDFGVPQSRQRVVIVAMPAALMANFQWPTGSDKPVMTVGECLLDLMRTRGWEGAVSWAEGANLPAPTIVGGSRKHGGPDLGPTRAKQAWRALGVDGMGISDHPPVAGFNGLPRLTVPMVARLQGFPDHWRFSGRKTAAYRQVGNAFPPPVAAAVATQIAKAIQAATATRAVA